MPVNAGMMREAVTLQTVSLGTANETGEQAESWSGSTTVRAEVRLLSGSEAYRAKQIHVDATYQLRIRYDSTITTTNRFVWGSLNLYPLSITHDTLKREMIVLCRQTS